jgi:hypothetical protein
MACGHCFHEVCILAYADSRDMTLHTVPCPICKLSRQQLSAASDQLMSGVFRGTGSSGSGGPIPAIDLLGDTTPPASPDEHPDDDKGKGKGNGNGKGKGKATDNGKGGKGNDEVADEVSLDDGFDLAVSLLGSSPPVHRAMAKPRATGKSKAKAKPQAKATGKGKGKGASVAAVDAAVVAEGVSGNGGDGIVLDFIGAAAATAKAKPKAKATGKGKGKGAAVAAVDAAVVADDPFAGDVAAGGGEGAAAAKAQAKAKPKAKATGKGKGKGKAVDAAVAADDPPADSGAILAVEAAAPPPADGDTLADGATVAGEAAAAVVATAVHPHFSSTEVLCDSCGRHEHFKRCRLIAKKSGRWQCSGCGCKAVMLRRKFGQWPTDAFSNLTPDCIERNPE